MEPARPRATSKRRNSDGASVRIGRKPTAPRNTRRNSARFRIRGRRVHRRERRWPRRTASKAALQEELVRRKGGGWANSRYYPPRGCGYKKGSEEDLGRAGLTKAF